MWRHKCTIPGAEKYDRIFQVLRRDPKAFREAFLRIDPRYRAMQVFTYQSWIWNESVRRLLIALLPGQSLIAISYQAGKLLFPREAPPEVLQRLRTQTVPLVGPETTFADPDVKKAVEWVLGREKLTLDKLVVPNTPEIFFRHEERPVLVFPGKLMLGPPRADEVNRGRKKIYVAFTLSPGAYATLVVRRLFHFSEQVNQDADEASEPAAAKPVPAPVVVAAPPAPPPEPRLGFRATQKVKKERKAKARADAPESKRK